MDSLYLALYHMGDFILIWIIIFGVFHCFYLEKYCLGKCYGYWLNHVSFEVLIRISSNLIHGFNVSCTSICGQLHVDILYYFLHFWLFFSVFLLRKIWSGNIIIFHHNFYFFAIIICIFHMRYALLSFLVTCGISQSTCTNLHKEVFQF